MGRSRDHSNSKSPSRSRSGSLSSTSSGRTAKARDWVCSIYFVIFYEKRILIFLEW
jgi:hypothetical protein